MEKPEREEFNVNYHKTDRKRDPNTIIVLMVAEKPSIAKSIAQSLSGGDFNTNKGESKFLNIHSYYGELFGKQ